MVILVLSQSMEKSLRICSRLEEQQHICAPVQDIPNLLEILENNIGSGIDLLICNYFVFSSATYNPYETMKELLHNVKIPFIFFNDPLLPAANKSMYWENSIRKYCPFSSSLDLTGIYRSFFMWLTINSSMEKLLNENVDNGLKNNMIVNEDELVSCAMELEIPNSRLELLRYFWKNQGKTLYSSDICKSIWNKDDDSTMQMLYTYISNLRHSFFNCIKYNMQIIRSGKNKYMFSAEKRKLIDSNFNVRDFLSMPAQYKVDF